MMINKIKTIVLLLSATLTMFLFLIACSSVNADENLQPNTLQINLGPVNFFTEDYDINKVHVVHRTEALTHFADIIDNDTNEVLDTVSCKRYGFRTGHAGPISLAHWHNVGGDNKVGVCADVEVYRHGSFSQFNKLLSYSLQIGTVITPMTFESKNLKVYSHKGTFPTTRLDYAFHRTLITKTNVTISTSINVQLLKAGFNASGTNYYRKYFSGSGRFQC